jgi:hypothetical protein
MSAPINDGGPAFPTPPGVQHNDGMTLRDYFAAAALQGMLSDACIAGSDLQLAENAYSYADAMLKAREAK